MEDNQVTVIEISADFLYLVTLGNKSIITDMVNNMKKYNSSDKKQYIAVKIDNPIANICFELTKSLNNNIDIEQVENISKIKLVIIDDGIEIAQCHTYAENCNEDLYMLMILVDNGNEYILGFPKFDFDDEEDPEIIIEKWFKKKNKKVPHGAINNIKYIAVVGDSTNILVISTEITLSSKIKNNLFI